MPSRILAFVCFLLLLAGAAGAQYAPFNNPHQQFFDNNGHPLAGGRISTYAAGTLNPLQTYSDIAGTPNTNPIVLDSGGFATIYLASASIYKFVVSNSTGIQQWTQDNIQAASGGGGPPGGITSINGDSTAAQRLLQGANIAISDTGGGAHTISAYGISGLPAGVLQADNFPGTDIAAKTNAAIAALPTNGGTVLFSCSNYPASHTSITITRNNVNLIGCGSGSMLGLNVGATTLNFAPGVPGFVVGTSGSYAYWAHLEGFAVVGSDTAPGSNDGINVQRAGPVHIIDVGIKSFGGRGLVLGNDTDLFYLERLEFDSNWGDGLYISSPCPDAHQGTATNLSATSNHGWGFNLQCGLNNTWNSPHASNNALGGWNVNTSHNIFNMVYVEGGVGSSFVINPGQGYNTVSFKAFGQPATVTNNGIVWTNEIHYAGNAGTFGQAPAYNFLSIASDPANPPQFFIFEPNPPGLLLHDFINNKDLFQTDSGGNIKFPQSISEAQYLDMQEIVAPSNPVSGNQRWYADNASHQLACLTSAGGSCAATGSGGSYPGVTSGGFGILDVSSTMNVGSSVPTACNPTTGCFALGETSTGGTPTPGVDYFRADSVTHQLKFSYNGGAETPLNFITSGSSILMGNGSGGNSNVTVGAGLNFSGGTLSANYAQLGGTCSNVVGIGGTGGVMNLGLDPNSPTCSHYSYFYGTLLTRNATLANLYVNSSVAGATADDGVVEILVYPPPTFTLTHTGVTCTMGVGNYSCHDTTHSYSASAGEYVTCRILGGATSSNVQNITCAVAIQ